MILICMTLSGMHCEKLGGCEKHSAEGVCPMVVALVAIATDSVAAQQYRL